MSLRTKFAALFALISVAVLGGLGAALWSFSMMEQEVSRPFEAVTAVLRNLAQLSERVQHIASVADPAHATIPDQSTVDALLAQAARQLDTLDDDSWYAALGGKTAILALRQHIRGGPRTPGLAGAVARWSADRSPESAAAVSAAAADARSLIDGIERHILAGAAESVRFGAGQRTRLRLVLLLSSLWVALVGALGFALLHRWVMQPVARLRTAAARIGAGDFAHRVPVRPNGPPGDELAQLSTEINHMAGLVGQMQDERVERERLAAAGEMVRRLTHNLRNPLAGIRGLAEITRADLPQSPSADELRENQERIIATVDRFEQWLAELLSATSPLSVHPEPAPVAPLLEALAATARPSAMSKEVQIDVDASSAPAHAAFDARHLEQALIAILSNAIDASPRGGQVRLWARNGPASDEWEIGVADQGPGIPEELLDRIFEPYFTTKRHGNGIGLAVAHQVVTAHRGRIHVAGGPHGSAVPPGGGPGAVFQVRLPLRP